MLPLVPDEDFVQEGMAGQEGFVAFSYQEIDAGIGVVRMKLFDEGGCEDNVTYKRRLYDEEFHRRTIFRMLFVLFVRYKKCSVCARPQDPPKVKFRDIAGAVPESRYSVPGYGRDRLPTARSFALVCNHSPRYCRSCPF